MAAFEELVSYNRSLLARPSSEILCDQNFHCVVLLRVPLTSLGFGQGLCLSASGALGGGDRCGDSAGAGGGALCDAAGEAGSTGCR